MATTPHDPFGTPAQPASHSAGLTDEDYERLAERWIDRETADAARIRRVDATEGPQLVGRRDRHGSSLAGLAIPYFRPGETTVREIRLRRDSPDLEQLPDGSTRETAKYLSPPGRGSLIYLPPRLTPEQVADKDVPLIFTEGEFKAIALDRLARHNSDKLRFVAIAIPGVCNFRGTIGKTEGPNGERQDLKGTIPDLDLITWERRHVLIAYDADSATNPSVQTAEKVLIKELRRRGATVAVLRWSLDDGKGIDDLLANKGPDYVLGLIKGVDWDEAIRSTEKDRQRQNQADVVVGIALGSSQLFVDDDVAFADIDNGVVRCTMKVNSKSYRSLLRHKYYLTRRKCPSAQAMTAAIATLEANARFAEPIVRRKVFTRTAEAEGKLYVDLGDDGWRAIEVDSRGWRIVSRPPVRFQRSPGMLPLPMPAAGGKLDDLQGLLNVRDSSDLILIAAWLLAALRPTGPFPLLSLSGEQGSAKSTAARTLRSLIDPNRVPLRTLPRNERDLYIAASHSHVLNYDNLSGISPWISDALCRLATGGGLTTRTLYENDEETMFEAMKPIILNGIEDSATRPDLADRSIVVMLEPILEADRKPENYLQARLEAAAPKVLGLLLDGLVRGLHRLDSVQFERLPRMADFASFAVACGDGSLWSDGGFMAAYEGNRSKAVAEVVESDMVAEAVRQLAQQGPWKGTASEMLERLCKIAGDKTANSKKWPATPRALSGRLRRVAPPLRHLGVNIEFFKEGHTRTRMIRLAARPPETESISPSASSANRSGNCEPKAYGRTQRLTQNHDEEASPSAASAVPPLRTQNDSTQTGAQPLPSASRPLKTSPLGDADGADAYSPYKSGPPPDDEMEI